MDILDRYIDQLLEKSTPQAPVWNLKRSAPERSLPGTIWMAV